MKRPRHLAILLLALLLFIALIGTASWKIRRIREQQRLDRALVAAVQRNDPAAVTRALAQGADPDARSLPLSPPSDSLWQSLLDVFHPKTAQPTARSTPLNMAAGGLPSDGPLSAAHPPDHSEIMRLLLDHGANINARNEIGRTPLMVATQSGWSPQTVRLLLDRGADINLRDNSDATPLIASVEMWGRTDNVRALLDRGADVNARTRYGGTALMFAAQSGRPEFVRLLLEHHADVNAQDKQGNTALSQALRVGNMVQGNAAPKMQGTQSQIAKILRQAGAKR